MLQIPWLDDEASGTFPPIDTALNEPNGLLAVGGNLSKERLLAAYKQGIFPWFSSGEPILWWSPNPRCVLFPEKLHISRSMRKWMKDAAYTIHIDTCFNDVIDACAQNRKQSRGTWITEEMQQAYNRLFTSGFAHSVECFNNDTLVGGLYGLSLGECFFGESMFSYETNASKMAFISMVKHLKNRGVKLIDCQVTSNHLLSLGAEEIPRSSFARLLKKHVNCPLPDNLWQDCIFAKDIQ